MYNTILIAGAGQLGSRYLQGLALIEKPLLIYIYDVSSEALIRAQNRWAEVAKKNTSHQVFFNQDLSVLPDQIDIAIITTTANVRPYIIEKIASGISVNYWLLEKVLAQNIEGIAKIERVLKNAANAWVNTSRRIIEWHQKIYATLDRNKPIFLSVTGGRWGLACNAIHFLDLLHWLTGEKPVSVDTSGLKPNWFESKRLGFWEVTDTLIVKFSGGSVVTLSSNDGIDKHNIHIQQGQFKWSIDEAEGIALRSDGFKITGKIPLQSELTTHLISSILNTGTCDLPVLSESARLHSLFLSELLIHWNTHMTEQKTELPIT